MVPTMTSTFDRLMRGGYRLPPRTPSCLRSSALISGKLFSSLRSRQRLTPHRPHPLIRRPVLIGNQVPRRQPDLEQVVAPPALRAADERSPGLAGIQPDILDAKPEQALPALGARGLRDLAPEDEPER